MPDHNQKISVIIPAYNIEKLIRKCVESCVSQDYPKELLEIIDKKDAAGMKGYLKKIRDNVRRDIEIKK